MIFTASLVCGVLFISISLPSPFPLATIDVMILWSYGPIFFSASTFEAVTTWASYYSSCMGSGWRTAAAAGAAAASPSR
jgi:hypothetical protein